VKKKKKEPLPKEAELELKTVCSTSPRTQKVLKQIFMEGPSTVYDLEKQLEIPHATMTKLVKKIYSSGFLSVVSEETFRTGLKTRKYFLTSKGFDILSRARVFLRENGSLDGTTLSRLDDITAQQLSTHPELKWWPAFRDAGPNATLLFFTILGQWEDFFANAVFTAFSSVEDAMHTLIPFTFTQVYGRDLNRLQQELIVLLKRNPELWKEVEYQLIEYEKSYAMNLKDIKKIRNILERNILRDQAISERDLG